jgi:hypothetical protein
VEPTAISRQYMKPVRGHGEPRSKALAITAAGKLSQSMMRSNDRPPRDRRYRGWDFGAYKKAGLLVLAWVGERIRSGNIIFLPWSITYGLWRTRERKDGPNV